MTARALAACIERRLRKAGDPARAEHEQRYLKSELRHAGASVPAIRSVVAEAIADHPTLFIRKIGWVLRDTARKRPDLVFAWLLPRAGRASGVTVREAVKPLSAAQRDAIVAARAQGSA